MIELERSPRRRHRVVNPAGRREGDRGVGVSDGVERVIAKPALDLIDRFRGSTKRYQVVEAVVESRQR